MYTYEVSSRDLSVVSYISLFFILSFLTNPLSFSLVKNYFFASKNNSLCLFYRSDVLAWRIEQQRSIMSSKIEKQQNIDVLAKKSVTIPSLVVYFAFLNEIGDSRRNEDKKTFRTFGVTRFLFYS